MISSSSTVKYLLLSLLFIFSTSCLKTSTNVTLNGVLSDVKSNNLYLVSTDDSSSFVKSIPLDKKGAFYYELEKPRSLKRWILYVDKSPLSIPFYVDKGTIRIDISGNIRDPYSIEVRGGTINNSLTQFKKENYNLFKKKEEILKNFQPLNSVDSTQKEKQTENLRNLVAVGESIKKKVEEFVRKSPNDPAGLILINDFLKSPEDFSFLDRSLRYVSDDQKLNPLYAQLDAYREKIEKTNEGARFPDFVLLSYKGDTIKTSSFYGKELILNFLSDSDKENQMSVDQLKSLMKKKFPEKEYQFCSIFVGKDRASALKTIKKLKELKELNKKNWSFIILKDGWASKIVRDLNIPFLPYNIIISSGTLIKKRNASLDEIN